MLLCACVYGGSRRKFQLFDEWRLNEDLEGFFEVLIEMSL